MITVSTIKLTSQPVSCGILRILPAQINSKGIDKSEKLNLEIHHNRKNEKVAVIVENIQITEI